MIFRSLIVGALLAGSIIGASAQAQQSPAETALQIDTVINGWAQLLEQQTREIAALQKRLADKTQEAAPKKDDKKAPPAASHED
jgi:hypothetical protein